MPALKTLTGGWRLIGSGRPIPFTWI